MTARGCILLLAMAAGASAEDSLVATLIRQLDDDDYDTREAAEAELFALGPAAAAEMKRAIPAAGEEGAARLRRILAWCGPEWGVAAEAAVRAALVDGRTEQERAWQAFRTVPMDGEALAPIRDVCRLFIVRMPDETARGSHEQVFAVWRDRAVTAWSANEPDRALRLANLERRTEAGRAMLVAIDAAIRATPRGADRE